MAPPTNVFGGRVRGVQLAIADAAESVDHLVAPEHALRIAMTLKTFRVCETLKVWPRKRRTESDVYGKKEKCP